MRRLKPVAVCDSQDDVARYSSQISSSSTTMRYHRYTKPNIAIAEERVGRQVHFERALGVAEVQLQRQRRNQQERQRGEQRQPVRGRTASTLNTRSSDARMKAPATSPVMKGYRTMRTLHWSSTSFGYMKPSTPGIIGHSYLTGRPGRCNRPCDPVAMCGFSTCILCVRRNS